VRERWLFDTNQGGAGPKGRSPQADPVFNSCLSGVSSGKSTTRRCSETWPVPCCADARSNFPNISPTRKWPLTGHRATRQTKTCATGSTYRSW